MEIIKSDLAFSKGEVLGQTGDIQVIRPDPPAFPLSEGIHLEVNTGDSVSWTQRNLPDILKMSFFSIPVAKTVAEGQHTSDFWANIHLNSYPNFNTGVNVFGRNPESDVGWGKPVVIRNVVEEELGQDEEQKLRTTFAKYLPAWANLLPMVKLFPNGVEQLASDDPDFQAEKEVNAQKNEKTIWANRKFSLVIVGDPHLSGMHLVVHPRDSYWKARGGFKRAWQISRTENGSNVPEHVQGFLEAMSIIVGAEKVLIEDEELPFYNPEIHFSGNWAPDLRHKDQGGKLSTQYLSQDDLDISRKEEKRKHRIGGHDQWQTSMHGHLYATRNRDAYVKLPTRPQKEVPQEWTGITPLMEHEENGIKRLIDQRLSRWLEQNARITE